MDSEIIQSGVSEQGESEVINDPHYIPLTKKFEVEIRHIIRIHPKDFEDLVNSFAEWANEWE
jgi:hypothetical protein